MSDTLHDEAYRELQREYLTQLPTIIAGLRGNIEAFRRGEDVAGELYAHWKFQTRAAQAIAARSFAVSEHVHYARSRDYDVTSTASSQVYVGLVKHHDTHRAVEATRGVVLGWEGMLVPGYYSACCGGLAATAADAIGGHPANDPGTHNATIDENPR